MNMASIKRGALIVIEGLDRSGKSTQCKMLVESLNKKNIKSQLITFPDRTTHTGKLINEYLSNKDCKIHDSAIHLLFAANRWENVDKMKNLMNEGVTLIVDRYSYSGIAFSAVKKGMDINWCKQPENGLPKPDRVFLLTLSGEEMSKRPGFGNERYEDVVIQKKVGELFLKLSTEDDNWEVMDAEGTREEVQSKLLEKVLEVINIAEATPLQYLNFNETRPKNGFTSDETPLRNGYH